MRDVSKAALLVLAVLAIRLPFLSQPVQGDDPYYLKGAEHALVDPLHPSHARYVFQGDVVDMRGHPHPPLNSWYLAALLAVFGDVREVPFHAVYAFFSFIAALSALSIARQFLADPLPAAMLFVVTPAFVINGNSFEADLPFVAFWLASLAFFLKGRFIASALCAAVAALTAYQAVMLAPVMLAWLWLRDDPKRRTAWVAIAAAPLAIAAYQVFERLTSGALPAEMLAGYMSAYSLQTLQAKLKNAVALTAHTGWLVFPLLSAYAFRREWIAGVLAAAGAALYDTNPLFWISIGAGAMVLCACVRQWRHHLAAWTLLFFAAALVLFFAGSARYLLPVAVPVSILVAARLKAAWLWTGVALSAALSLSLATVNFEHQRAYRDLYREAPRVFTNAEWGLRYALESKGARELRKEDVLWPGDALITSAYSRPVENTPLATVAEREIQSAIPLRIVGLGSKSGYSSVVWGLRPFEISRAPLDRVRIDLVTEREVRLSWLDIGKPEAAPQLVSGIYNSDRWTGARAVAVLHRPPQATTLEVNYWVPPQSPARSVQLLAGGRVLATDTFTAPGLRKITAPAPPGDIATVTLVVDRTFTVPPDQRQLGVMLTSLGFAGDRQP